MPQPSLMPLPAGSAQDIQKVIACIVLFCMATCAHPKACKSCVNDTLKCLMFVWGYTATACYPEVSLVVISLVSTLPILVLPHLYVTSLSQKRDFDIVQTSKWP